MLKVWMVFLFLRFVENKKLEVELLTWVTFFEDLIMLLLSLLVVIRSEVVCELVEALVLLHLLEMMNYYQLEVKIQPTVQDLLDLLLNCHLTSRLKEI